MKKLLEVENLSFSYGKNKVIDRISFTLNEGEMLFILGPNGAGKSTLFRCILGLDASYSGRVLVCGEDIRRKSPGALASLMAYVPQAHHPSFNYSVLDMVLMGTAAGKHEWTLPGEKDRRRALEALDKLNMASFSGRSFRELSGGEQQLVLIARALAQNARILIMDEPSASLDYGNQLRLLFRIQELKALGYSIFLSSHNPNHTFLFADRFLALHNRKIAGEGPPAEALGADLIFTLYGVKVKLVRDEGGVSCVPLT